MKLALFGATGTAGSGVLRTALADDAVTDIIAPVRRALAVEHPKLKPVICADFADLSACASSLRGVDLALYSLGVSQSQAPVEADYRRITYTYALHAAHTLQRESPAAVFHFLSGQGTSPTSLFMWARVKGETELALADLKLAGLVCFRPGYIHPHGPRTESGFAARVGNAIYPMLKGLRGMSVESVDLGAAMLQRHHEGAHSGTLENGPIRDLAERYRARRA